MPGSWIHSCISWMQPTECFDLAQAQPPQVWLVPASPVILVQCPPWRGWDTAARQVWKCLFLLGAGCVQAGLQPAAGRLLLAQQLHQPPKSLSLEEVGQGGACTGTALMVPSCFSSPWLEGKVDFGIWNPLLYSRLLFTPAFLLHLHQSSVKPCLPMSNVRPPSPSAALPVVPSTKQL